jgi:hypothetical protein
VAVEQLPRKAEARPLAVERDGDVAAGERGGSERGEARGSGGSGRRSQRRGRWCSAEGEGGATGKGTGRQGAGMCGAAGGEWRQGMRRTTGGKGSARDGGVALLRGRASGR